MPREASSLVEPAGEDHLDPLGVGVEGGAVEVATLELEVVGVELLGVHAARGDEDDRRGRAGGEGGDEQLGQKQRPEDVGGEGQLVAVDARLALLRQDAGVVDEGGDARAELLGESGAELANGVERGQVAPVEVELVAAGRLADPRAGVGTALEVADDHVHASAERGELLRRRGADPRVGAGDDDVAAGEPALGVGGGPGEAADAVADRAEAGEHGPVEQPVDCSRATDRFHRVLH